MDIPFFCQAHDALPGTRAEAQWFERGRDGRYKGTPVIVAPSQYVVTMLVTEAGCPTSCLNLVHNADRKGLVRLSDPEAPELSMNGCVFSSAGNQRWGNQVLFVQCPGLCCNLILVRTHHAVTGECMCQVHVVYCGKNGGTKTAFCACGNPTCRQIDYIQELSFYRKELFVHYPPAPFPFAGSESSLMMHKKTCIMKWCELVHYRSQIKRELLPRQYPSGFWQITSATQQKSMDTIASTLGFDPRSGQDTHPPPAPAPMHAYSHLRLTDHLTTPTNEQESSTAASVCDAQ